MRIAVHHKSKHPAPNDQAFGDAPINFAFLFFFARSSFIAATTKLASPALEPAVYCGKSAHKKSKPPLKQSIAQIGQT